jgi:hypothetical protein
MKVKDLKQMLDKFGDETEITFFSCFWDKYDDYEGAMASEESYQATFYLTEHDTAMLVPSGSDMSAVKKLYPGGMTLYELVSTFEMIKSKPLWLKLLEREKNDEHTRQDSSE